ncbi:MAG: hypothetical protein JW846_01865 [Dehalococcoidia bacterium]|nr:hypothetical protein [Dehalococcoidia bacterium]
MKKLLFVIFALLVALPGCSYIMPQSNQPPQAYIDDVSPLEPLTGEVVNFVGHGTDVDGDVVAYRWRSDKDGELSSTKSFTVNSLSVGDHIIFFKVQDNNGAWSAEVRRSVKVLPGAPIPAKVKSFAVSPSSIEEGDTATLSWEILNSSEVSINQGIGVVQPLGEVDVSPESTTTYTITATGGGATATAQVTVEVDPAELEIVSFEADPESVLSGEVSTLSWVTKGATEVRILPLIGVVELSGTHDVTPTGEQTYTFTLVATDGDETITRVVEVESSVAMPDSFTKVLTPTLTRSGYVRDNGQVTKEYIYVGDDNNDYSLQAFMSFDISVLPDDAMLTSVTVDFSDYYQVYGTPFDDLGCLRCYVDDYGSLGSSDYYTGSPTGAIDRWCDLDDLDDVAVNGDFKDALEDKLGDDWFQLRLQFTDDETDGNGDNDIVLWKAGDLPRLTVKYYSYEEE